jgi:hypothetical protein
MGYHAKLFADCDGSSEQDVTRSGSPGLVPGPAARAPIQGFVLRNGQAIPYTLDTTDLAPESHRVLPEQIAIGALLLASFIAPIRYLLG